MHARRADVRPQARGLAGIKNGRPPEIRRAADGRRGFSCGRARLGRFQERFGHEHVSQVQHAQFSHVHFSHLQQAQSGAFSAFFAAQHASPAQADAPRPISVTTTNIMIFFMDFLQRLHRCGLSAGGATNLTKGTLHTERCRDGIGQAREIGGGRSGGSSRAERNRIASLHGHPKTTGRVMHRPEASAAGWAGQAQEVAGQVPVSGASSLPHGQPSGDA